MVIWSLFRLLTSWYDQVIGLGGMLLMSTKIIMDIKLIFSRICGTYHLTDL